MNLKRKKTDYCNQPLLTTLKWWCRCNSYGNLWNSLKIWREKKNTDSSNQQWYTFLINPCTKIKLI